MPIVCVPSVRQRRLQALRNSGRLTILEVEPLNDEHIQALNYSAHAIEDLTALASQHGKLGYFGNAENLMSVAELLRRSVKFIMPNCGDLIHGENLKPVHLDLMRLPFPCVAFEAPWDNGMPGPRQIGRYEQVDAPKRIALCWESKPGHEVIPQLNDFLRTQSGDGIFVLSLYWSPETRRWSTTLGGMFLPYDNQVERSFAPAGLSPASEIAYRASVESGIAGSKAPWLMGEPWPVLPELFTKTVEHFGDAGEALGQIIVDVHDEALMMLQACAMLNCANITTIEQAPSAASNKKRQGSGKQPFFTYNMLQLKEEPRSMAFFSSSEGTSPRMHLRRGHLRRLDSKAVWVRPTTVNAASNLGIAVKDYRVAEHA